MSFQLLGKDSLSTDDIVTAEKEWATYVDNFVLAESTMECQDQPYLRRLVKKTFIFFLSHKTKKF